MADTAENNGFGYPRVLDRCGCLYGQARYETAVSSVKSAHRRVSDLEESVTKLEKKLEANMDNLEEKIDKLMTVALAAAIGLATSAILLAINLLV